MIHLLIGGRYRIAPESRVFTGWTAEEIHIAMNEPDLSATSSDALTRVGRALGGRGGTRPDHIPWLRTQRREARAETMTAVADRILASRGMSGLALPLDAEELAGATSEEIVDALLQCRDEPDLRARLLALRRRPAYRPDLRA